MIQLFILFMLINLAYEKIMNRKENIIKKIRWLQEMTDMTSDDEIISSDLETTSVEIENDNPTTKETFTDLITEKSTTSETTGISTITSEVSDSELSDSTSVIITEVSGTSETATTSPLSTTTSLTVNDTTFDAENTTFFNTTKSSSSLSTGEICGIVIPCSAAVIIVGATVAYVATCGAAGAVGATGAIGAAGVAGAATVGVKAGVDKTTDEIAARNGDETATQESKIKIPADKI